MQECIMQENGEQLVDFDRLKQLVSDRAILWREHALQRMNERRISKADVKTAILSGEIIEDYPDAYPTPSCLVFGCTVSGRRIHVVCGVLDEMAVIITAYRPDVRKWQPDGKTRR